jgi:hypothetical protein
MLAGVHCVSSASPAGAARGVALCEQCSRLLEPLGVKLDVVLVTRREPQLDKLAEAYCVDSRCRWSHCVPPRCHSRSAPRGVARGTLTRAHRLAECAGHRRQPLPLEPLGVKLDVVTATRREPQLDMLATHTSHAVLLLTRRCRGVLEPMIGAASSRVGDATTDAASG